MKRRDLIKWGLGWGGASLVSERAMHFALSQDSLNDGPSLKMVSPPTRPFVVPLQIPPVAKAVKSLTPAPTVQPNTAAGEGRTRPHQALTLIPPRKFYAQHLQEALHGFHPDLPLNLIWGYDGVFPGSTFFARYGEPILVRRFNDLPSDHVGFGIPSVTAHLHNGHTPSESDGFPGDFFESGFFYDHHYPNVLAGFTEPAFAATQGDPRETMSTLWYHDHRVDFTSQNVYKGLAGFYLLFSEQDSGDETDPNPNAFRLPSGKFDVPLIFADKVFTPDGELFFDIFNLDGILGDKHTVNGVIQPFFKVERRKYRFRLLNSGPSRFLEFFLTDGKRDFPYIQISNDGNLLPAPLTVNSVRLGVAERPDIIIDFSQFKKGTKLFLENRLEQKNGRGPTGKILARGAGDRVLRLDVDRDAKKDPSRVPDKLLELPPVDLNEVRRVRNFRFDRRNGAWNVNGKFFNVNEIRADPKRNTAELWVLRNDSGGWSHPIHIHFEEFQILSRNGRQPPPVEIARKDMVILGPNEEVRLFIRFRDFVGRYPMHCHNVVHEDHAMMIRFDITP
jgi:FtsP/CotA-like multicopper oxidase with cupredoxin domain